MSQMSCNDTEADRSPLLVTPRIEAWKCSAPVWEETR